jgi:RNA polymerase sigma factor (sigma-70 family)
MAAVPSIGRAAGVELGTASSAEATADLYERYSGPIFGYCFNQLGSREEAEDATQSTFLNAHRALDRGTTPEAAGAWLFKIAHNVCLSRRRSAYRRGRVEAPSDLQAVQDLLAAPQREGSDDLLRLTDALAHMPDNQRRAILLREWQGLSYREIGDELGLSQPAVETLIFRARRTLAGNLEQAGRASAEPVQKARKALDLGAIATLLKGLLVGGSAVKAAATAVAVTGAAVAVTAPLAPKHAPHAQKAPPAKVRIAKPRVVPTARRTASAAPPQKHAPRPAPHHVTTPKPVPRAAPAPPAPPQTAPEPQEPATAAPTADQTPADPQQAEALEMKAGEQPETSADPTPRGNANGKDKDKAKDEPAQPAEQAQPEDERGNGKGTGRKK